VNIGNVVFEIGGLELASTTTFEDYGSWAMSN
jgi:hypothetical protein